MSGTAPKLKRELHIWETIGISIALMAPSMAANINPQGVAGTVGRAVPLAFLLATVGVVLVAWTFVRLSQRFHHAGSVYGFVGVTLGPQAGVVAGWALLGAYLFYGVVTSMAAGIFGSTVLTALGWSSQPSWFAFVIALAALAGVFALNLAPIRRGTRILLTVEALTVALILVVAVVVFIRLALGNAPSGHGITFSPFSLDKGTSFDSVFLGIVFGFLSFAGFEAAATLGEESRNPRKDIPRAILGTAVFGGLYFVIVTWIEMIGFGTDKAGVDAFHSSGSLMGDLGASFIAPVVGDVISLGAAVSAFGCALACTVGAARMIFAISRDGVGPSFLTTVSTKNRAPVGASIAAVAFVLVTILGSLAVTRDPWQPFLWSATIGTIILLVAYVLATVGAVKLVFFSGPATVPWYEIVIPVLGLGLLAKTIWTNIAPVFSTKPTFTLEAAGFWQAVLSIVWVALGLALIIFRPAVARRAGERLVSEDGLSATPADLVAEGV